MQNKLKDLRIAKGLTQLELARKLPIDTGILTGSMGCADTGRTPRRAAFPLSARGEACRGAGPPPFGAPKKFTKPTPFLL